MFHTNLQNFNLILHNKCEKAFISLSLYTTVPLTDFSTSEKNTLYQNMDGMVSKIISVFRILPFWPTFKFEEK